MKKYRVLFIDLDGTLIETVTGGVFPKGVWDMKLKFDVIEAIKNLGPEAVCIVSNQGGIEKGYIDECHFNVKIEYIRVCICELIGIENVSYAYCIENDPSSFRRKPNTGMLEAFCNIRYWYQGKKLEKEEILMVGDASGKEGQFSDSDKKTAENFDIDYLDVEDFVKEYNKPF